MSQKLPSAKTLPQLLALRAEHHPERIGYTFLSDGERGELSLSYAELATAARRIAARLLETLAPGDRVLLLYQPGLDYVAAIFGCLWAGVIAVPAYPPRARRALPRLLALARESGATAALTSAAMYASFSDRHEALPAASTLRWIVTDRDDQGPEAPPTSLGPEAIAFLQYTSGSTSSPKGVVLSHANLLDNLAHIHRRFGVAADSSGVFWLPPYHDMGLIGGILQPLYGGAPVTLMSPFAFLQRPLRWLEAITRLQATTNGGPNFAYQLLADRVSDEQLATLDLRSWQVAFTGAEPVRIGTLERFAERFAPAGFDRRAFYPCYGLAEATLMVSGGQLGSGPRVARVQRAALERGEALAAADPVEACDLVSCGQALEGQEVVIVDPQTRVAAPASQVGEIWVRGPSVASSYWSQPEESEALLRARRADTDEGPYLRTGDLGFLQDGELYVTGRIKDLILIAGRNLYPQDMELSAEQSHPGLRQGCSAAFAVESPAEERLVLVHELEREAIRNLDPEPVFRAIRRALAAELQVPVAAIVLVKPGSIPKTSSGKIQRSATRERYLRGELERVAEWSLGAATGSLLEPLAAASVPPRTPVEASLVEIWAEVLNRDAVGVHDDFFEWGGQSLLATQVLSRIADTFGVSLPVRALFEAPTVAALASRVEAALGGAPREGLKITPVPRGVPLPLAYSQERMWFIHQLQPESSAYNLGLALRIRGPLDTAAMQRSIHRIVERHDSLRTRIVTVDGMPSQEVAPRLPVELSLAELRGVPAEGREAQMLQHIRSLLTAHFDLARLPLVRFALLRLDEAEHVLAIVMHHVVADAWSFSVLARELGKLYQAFAGGRPDPLPPLSLQYADFAAWQRATLSGPRLEAQLSYWRQRLQGVPVLSLPTDYPRQPMQRGRGSFVSVSPQPRLLEALRGLGRAHNATLFMTLLTAYVVLLHRYSGQRDFAVGVPIANRHHQASEELVGTLVNTLALRFDLGGDPSFLELLAQVRETALAAYAHQDLPFEQLVATLDLQRDLSHGPLFQVMFDFINVATPATQLGDLSLSLVEVDRGAAQFDLTLVAADTRASQQLSFEYDTDLYERATVERMLAELLCLLQDAVANPSRPISELELLPAAERRLLVEDWNRTVADYPRDCCIDQLVSAQARRSPAAVAVRHRERSLSYWELEQRSEALARYLRALGVTAEVPVGLCLERSPEMVVALLGVLKAGGAYLPLDPAFPRERLQGMLADSEASVLLTEASLVHGIAGEDERGRRLVLIDRDWEAIAAAPATLAAQPRSPDDLAYLIYTSGSTGKPKGVQVSHRSVVNFLESMRREPGLSAADVLLSVTTLSFDIAVLELLLPLVTGATTVVVDREVVYDGRRLAQTLEAVGATVLQATPATWRMLLDSDWAGRPDLKALCGGEPLAEDLARQLLGRVQSLWNMYGPTETTVWSTTRRISSGTAPITVGRPIANTRTYILDEQLRPVPCGASGQLWIGGDGVARGYHKHPELSAERFRPDPFSPEPGGRMYATGDLARFRAGGDIEVLGRLDFQVKVRGFRIELGEIENALSRIPGVHQALVSTRDDNGVNRLVGYLVPEPTGGATPPSATELRHRLLESLPDYMVPSHFLYLERFPLTPNGKIDRLALPEPEARRPALDQRYQAPRTPYEETLADICAELLGLDRVGIYDNFFALGGHSLLATRMVSRIRSRLGAELPLRVFFERPTVAELAAYIGDQQLRALDEATLAALLAEVRELAPDSPEAPAAESPVPPARRRAQLQG